MNFWQQLWLVEWFWRTIPPFLFSAVFLWLVGCGKTAVSPPATPSFITLLNTPTPPPAPTPTLPPTTTPLPATNTPSPTYTPTPTTTPSPTPCTEKGYIATGLYQSSIAGAMGFRVYVPPCYEENGRSYPTLYLLPGNIHTDDIWDELGIDETAETAIHNQTIPPLLIVMVDGGWVANNTSGGPNSYEAVVLNEIIPFIESRYCVWNEPAGRAIGGLSRGGYWSLEIAFRHPEQFASVGGHSAALIDSYAGPDLNPQYTALTNPLGDLRIYLDIGENDYLLPNLRRLHEDMMAAGIPHEWVLNQGQHEEAYWMAHLADYLEWYTAPWSHERDSYPMCTP